MEISPRVCHCIVWLPCYFIILCLSVCFRWKNHWHFKCRLSLWPVSLSTSSGSAVPLHVWNPWWQWTPSQCWCFWFCLLLLAPVKILFELECTILSLVVLAWTVGECLRTTCSCVPLAWAWVSWVICSRSRNGKLRELVIHTSATLRKPYASFPWEFHKHCSVCLKFWVSPPSFRAIRNQFSDLRSYKIRAFSCDFSI